MKYLILLFGFFILGCSDDTHFPSRKDQVKAAICFCNKHGGIEHIIRGLDVREIRATCEDYTFIEGFAAYPEIWCSK